MLSYLLDASQLALSVAPKLLLAIIGIAASATVFTVVQKSVSTLFRIPGLTGDPIPVAHKIAVIGLPGAGKTTLITGLFELIQRGSDLENVRLRGFQTIETVNRNIARLNSGLRIGPTKERDVFIFRFSYLKAARLVTRLYDVEIADFPGEYSERISKISTNEKVIRTKRRRTAALVTSPETPSAAEADSPDDFSYTLFNREFFSWIASAREYLFVVDLAAIYSDSEPRAKIAEIIARIRTSWQVIEDASTDRALGGFRDREIHIIFTKLDVLVLAYRFDYTLGDLLNTGSSKSENKTSIDGLRSKLREGRNTTELASPQREADTVIAASATTTVRYSSILPISFWAE